jgi:hypothetical protein
MFSGNAEYDRSATAFMARHFVALACDYESLHPDGSVFHRDTAIFSGFIVEFLGMWFWVTAGGGLLEAVGVSVSADEDSLSDGRVLSPQ